MRLYISGTISSDPALSFEQAKARFDAAAAHLRVFGYEPVNPVDLDGECGQTPEQCLATQQRQMPGQGQGQHSWECYLRGDIRAMLLCDGVALLPNWERSAGARLEFATAVACGIDCRPLDQWLPDPDPATGARVLAEKKSDIKTANCARCLRPEWEHRPGGLREGCTYAGPGETTTTCSECRAEIHWDGVRWHDNGEGLTAACPASKDPDVAHAPAGAGDLR